VTRKSTIKLTKFEMEIMDALWALGSGSIREVHERLPEKRRPAYTTVQTIIRRLEEKGAVRQTKQVGNAHIFEPAFTRDAAHRRLIDDLLDLFGGSARPLMAHLAEAGKLTLKDVKELESLLSDREDRQTGQPPTDEARGDAVKLAREGRGRKSGKAKKEQ
jgi:predicted transcriptional regulator